MTTTEKALTEEELKAKQAEILKDLDDKSSDPDLPEPDPNDPDEDDVEAEKKDEEKKETKIDDEKEKEELEKKEKEKEKEELEKKDEEKKETKTDDETEGMTDEERALYHSRREAIILHNKEKKMNEAVEKGKNLPPPTDDEMRTDYPEWDEMSDVEKRLAKNDRLSKQRFALIEEITQESRDAAAWNEKIDTLLDDPKTLIKFPQLENKIEKFKLFATKPTRRSADFETLVESFSFRLSKEKPKNNSTMFPDGKNRAVDNKKRNDGKLSIEEGRALKKSNYRQYSDLLQEGKIASEDI